MIITATEFKNNLGKYLQLAAAQDIFITKNGQSIARLTSPSMDKLAALDSLVGIAESEAPLDKDEIRKERLTRQ